MWFSAGRGMKVVENDFLTHSWESEYKCAGGFRSHGMCKVQFLFCHPPLPDIICVVWIGMAPSGV